MRTDTPERHPSACLIYSSSPPCSGPGPKARRRGKKRLDAIAARLPLKKVGARMRNGRMACLQSTLPRLGLTLPVTPTWCWQRDMWRDVHAKKKKKKEADSPAALDLKTGGELGGCAASSLWHESILLNCFDLGHLSQTRPCSVVAGRILRPFARCTCCPTPTTKAGAA